MINLIKCKLGILALLLLLVTQASSESFIPITLDHGNKTLLSVFSPEGTITNSLEINQKEKNSFISGNFGPSYSKIGILLIDTNINFKLHDVEGTLAVSIDLGKKKLIKSLLANDLDQDGMDDLVVINKQGLISYYPASTSFQQQIDFGIVHRGKSYLLLTKNSTPYLLASVKQNRKGGKILISNLYGAIINQLKIPKGTVGILPIDQGLNNEPIFAFAKKNKLILTNLNGGKLSIVRLQKDVQTVSKDVLELGYDQIVVVKDDKMQILDPINKVSLLENNLSFSDNSDSSSSDPCGEFQNIMAQAIVLMMQGREDEANALMADLQQYMECFGAAFGSGGYQASSEAKPQLVSDQFHLASGGAGGSTGPCDNFMNPNDGAGGFLAKDSDNDGRIVVLTPGGHYYESVEILNLRYNKLELLRYSGWGNPDYAGLRMHFRGSRTVRSYGQFIVAAHSSSGTTCWKVTNPSSRVD